MTPTIGKPDDREVLFKEDLRLLARRDVSGVEPTMRVRVYRPDGIVMTFFDFRPSDFEDLFDFVEESPAP